MCRAEPADTAAVVRPYILVYVGAYVLALGAMLLAPERFLYWWWD